MFRSLQCEVCTVIIVNNGRQCTITKCKQSTTMRCKAVAEVEEGMWGKLLTTTCPLPDYQPGSFFSLFSVFLCLFSVFLCLFVFGFSLFVCFQFLFVCFCQLPPLSSLPPLIFPRAQSKLSNIAAKWCERCD